MSREQIASYARGGWKSQLISSDSYLGTDEDLGEVEKLMKTPEFREAYPEHILYVVKNGIIGVIPRTEFKIEPDGPEVIEARAAVKKELEQRGISYANCAIIATGPSRFSMLISEQYIVPR